MGGESCCLLLHKDEGGNEGMSHAACYCIKMRGGNEGMSHAACYCIKMRGNEGVSHVACYCIKMRGRMGGESCCLLHKDEGGNGG